MRRILLVLTVALMMAAMMVAVAMPAFARGVCDHPGPDYAQETSCFNALEGYYIGQSHRK